MTIRTLIVDDEPIARRGIARHLSAHTDVQAVGQCGDGASAIAAIVELAPDLVFLDVQMPGLSGFDVIDAVGLARMPPVIFVTAFDQYAVRAFDVHAIDYVLKPIDGERFRQALDRARRQISHPHVSPAQSIAGAFQDLGRPSRAAMPGAWRSNPQAARSSSKWTTSIGSKPPATTSKSMPERPFTCSERPWRTLNPASTPSSSSGSPALPS